MIVPPLALARASASALLPLAVVPAISASGGRDSPPYAAGVSMFVATLVASQALRQGDIEEAADRLAQAGCAPSGQAVIDPGKAVDPFFAADPVAARTALTGLGAQVDVIVQPAGIREKALLI